MKFTFNLEWDELSEDLREQKIQEYIDNNLLDYQDVDEEIARQHAEYSIRARFPIYF